MKGIVLAGDAGNEPNESSIHGRGKLKKYLTYFRNVHIPQMRITQVLIYNKIEYILRNSIFVIGCIYV